MYSDGMTASSPTTNAPAAETHDHSHGSARWELWFAIAAGVTYAGGMIAEFAMGLPMVGWPLGFFLATYFFGGFREDVGRGSRKVQHGSEGGTPVGVVGDRLFCQKMASGKYF